MGFVDYQKGEQSRPRRIVERRQQSARRRLRRAIKDSLAALADRRLNGCTFFIPETRMPGKWWNRVPGKAALEHGLHLPGLIEHECSSRHDT